MEADVAAAAAMYDELAAEAENRSPFTGDQRSLAAATPVVVRFGRIVISETKSPSMFVNLV
jgi:hypothetical protein